MNDILLTDTEIMRVAHVGDRNEIEAVCRAQVRKVAKWVEETSTCKATCEDCWMGCDYWQRLREAGL